MGNHGASHKRVSEKPIIGLGCHLEGFEESPEMWGSLWIAHCPKVETFLQLGISINYMYREGRLD